jgi:hypothetical protein
MLLAASIVLFLLGALHSGLGELMIFESLPRASGLPGLGFPPLIGAPESAVRTMRACWHLLTVFGWGFALLLGRYAMQSELGAGDAFVVRAMAGALLACALVMLVGTRGKHLGFAAFFAAAVLCWLGAPGE